jgi:predicted SAM-dependent methyltransferase
VSVTMFSDEIKATDRTEPLRLNLGSGPTHIDGFLNVDFNAAEEPDIIANVGSLPFFDSTVDEIYASHVLEHTAYNAPVLEEWARVLKPGGLLTVTVPDIVATYYAWKHDCAFWGGEDDPHPVDLQYLNACAFGGKVLGPEWDHQGQYHEQIFIFDMLVERMRPLFPDAHEVAAYQVGRQQAKGVWLCETTVQGHNGKSGCVGWPPTAKVAQKEET